MATVGDLLAHLWRRAPREVAEPGDNIGLLVGDPSQVVNRALVCLDVTPAALDAARSAGAELVLAHHPVIFTPQATFAVGGSAAVPWQAARAGLSVICMHTNVDAAPGGLADEAARMLGLTDISPLVPTGGGTLQKLVVFVPETHAEQVLAALAGAGAGVIGKYDYCSFSTPGTGTFRAQPGAQPFLGHVGEIERASEIRLETIMPKAQAGRVVAAMLAAHPYEEVAFDLYNLDNTWPGAGLGRVGMLPAPLSAGAFTDLVAERFGGHLRVAGSRPEVRRVAILPGGGGGKYVFAAAAAGVDAYLTGDINHHDAVAAAELGLLLVAAGHYCTEIPVVPLLARWCRDLGLQVHELTDSPWQQE